MKIAGILLVLFFLSGCGIQTELIRKQIREQQEHEEKMKQLEIEREQKQRKIEEIHEKERMEREEEIRQMKESMREIEETIPSINETGAVTLGQILLSYERKLYYSKPYPYTYNMSKFDLTVTEVSEQRIGLSYSEYMGKEDSWLIKQGFTKELSYSPRDKIIRFRDYEFEILSVENGIIKYRRQK